jgi:hypothetical protein
LVAVTSGGSLAPAVTACLAIAGAVVAGRLQQPGRPAVVLP